MPSVPSSYAVKAGDSLAKIALRVYGDATKWRRIYDANRTQIRNPDAIRPGQVLVIPAAAAGCSTPVPKQRSMMTPQEQLDNPAPGASYPIELEVVELVLGAAALLRGLAKQGIKLFARTAAKSKGDDVFKVVVNPKTGKKEFPNSPYRDKSRDPRAIMEEINEQVAKDVKAARSADGVARENAEIARIHKEFIETGKWPLKRKDLGEYHMSTPDAALIQARKAYLKALNEHGG
jgi:LysM repeat protein